MRIQDELLALKHSLSIETSPRALVAIEIQIARLNVTCGEDDQALIFADLARQRAHLVGDVGGEAHALALLANARAHCGDTEQAKKCLDAACLLVDDNASSELVLEICEAALALQDVERARKMADRVNIGPNASPVDATRAFILQTHLSIASRDLSAARLTADAAAQSARRTKRTFWQAQAVLARARLEASSDAIETAEAAYVDAIALFEANSEDNMVAETEVELAICVAQTKGERPAGSKPPAFWLGQALTRLQSSGQHRAAQRIRGLLQAHGRRMTDKLLDAHPVSELSRIQERVSKAQNATRAVDELMQRLFEELDRGDPAQRASVTPFLREGLAEHIGEAGATLRDVRNQQQAFVSTIQELFLEQDHFGEVLEAIESLFSMTDDAKLPKEIVRAAGRLTGASGVALLTSDALVVDGSIDLAEARAKDLARYRTDAVPGNPQAASDGEGRHGSNVEGDAGPTLIERLVRDGRVVGIIYCRRDSGRFSQLSLRQLKRFIPLMGTLLENRRLAAEQQLDAITRRATLEAISDAVFMLTEDDTLLVMNSRAASVLGVPEGTTSVPIERHASLKELSGVLRNGDTRQLDGRIVSIDEARYLLNARSVPGTNAWVVTMVELKRAASLVNNIVGAKARYTFKDIVRHSDVMHKLVQLAEQLAPLPNSVLVFGESGTGKEMFAQAIHNGSRGRGAPFVAVNCAAIPRDLLESELFGYEPGAFTGALRRGRAGKFELADGGTLFLDEVGEMPMEMQSKLLRVLQDKQVERIGAGRSLEVDVRIIAATNRNLEDAVARGMFRQDLYFRLRGVQLTIPPLRERPEDIVALVEHLMKMMPQRFNKALQSVSPSIMQHLVAYRWPGNARELEQALELEISLAAPHALVIDWVPTLLQNQPEAPSQLRAMPTLAVDEESSEDALSLEHQERTLLIEALRRFHGSVPEVARAVGLSRATVYNKLSKYNLNAKSFRD